MAKFILLTRLVREEVHPSFSFISNEKNVVEQIRKYLPDVHWISNFVVLGPWDYCDVFEADDMETALQVSVLVRYYGGAHTEIWPVQEWAHFKKSLSGLVEVLEK